MAMLGCTYLPTVRAHGLGQDQPQSSGVVPWFSYQVKLPVLPLPRISERPHIKTQHLLIRPLLPSDLNAFHKLRRRQETQQFSNTRGRADRNREETLQHLQRLNSCQDVCPCGDDSQDDQSRDHHWYFGAFLRSTGELVGEGGLPPGCLASASASGWPEPELLILPEHRRRGLGTELFAAVMRSWWALPREAEPRRRQLAPAAVPPPPGRRQYGGADGSPAAAYEPGELVPEAVVLRWDDRNPAALPFFARALLLLAMEADGAAPVVSAAEGFEAIDTREGREGSIVRWEGALLVNPWES